MIKDCSKFAQEKYKTWYDKVGNGIHWELCKNLKVDHTNKCYIHNPESFQENETYKVLYDFEIQKIT